MSQEQKLMETLEAMAVHGWVFGQSFPKLAKASGVGLRSIPRHIKRLEKSGAIRCHNERGRGRINSYQILRADTTGHTAELRG